MPLWPGAVSGQFGFFDWHIESRVEQAGLALRIYRRREMAFLETERLQADRI